MRAIEEQELLAFMEDETKSFAVFGYTPFCGTCKLAGRMLEIVLHMMPELDLYQINVNFAPAWVRQLHVSSVPCLLLFEKGEEISRRYRFTAVDELVRFLSALKQA